MSDDSNGNPQATEWTELVRKSALWSAWSDALGFISELTDSRGLARRLKTNGPLTEPVAWKRRVGGRFGVQVELPEGCYSDDTQLRLAVGRAIGSDRFDVEAFARVELPVWPAYALGGGRATRAAAAGMAKGSTPWFGNLYSGWLQAGGNGAAMRIQPHVWSAKEFKSRKYLADVLCDSVVSHGHPNALVGAVLHALALEITLTGGILNPDHIMSLIDSSVEVPAEFLRIPEISAFWLPSWEHAVGESFESAWQETIESCRRDFLQVEAIAASMARSHSNGASAEQLNSQYGEILDALKLKNPDYRGSGTGTAIAAMCLAFAFRDDPGGAARCAATALDSDTDTIATMAGAILGATVNSPEPPVSILDRTYIERESVRLAGIALGHPDSHFTYPDLLHWVPPRSQLDTVGDAGGKLALSGLTWLDGASEAVSDNGREAVWRWTTSSSYSASYLVKHRMILREIPHAAWPRTSTAGPSGHDFVTESHQHVVRAKKVEVSQGTDETSTKQDNGALHSSALTRSTTSMSETRLGRKPTVDEVMRWLRAENFSDMAIGYSIRRVALGGSIEQLVALTSTLRTELRREAPSHSLSSLSRNHFEWLLGNYIERMGGVRWTTSSSEDSGVDGWFVDAVGHTTAFQVKMHDRPVGTDAVRELIEVLDRVGAAQGILVASSRFTAASVRDAREDGRIRLVAGHELAEKAHGE